MRAYGDGVLIHGRAIALIGFNLASIGVPGRALLARARMHLPTAIVHEAALIAAMNGRSLSKSFQASASSEHVVPLGKQV